MTVKNLLLILLLLLVACGARADEPAVQLPTSAAADSADDAAMSDDSMADETAMADVIDDADMADEPAMSEDDAMADDNMADDAMTEDEAMAEDAAAETSSDLADKDIVEIMNILVDGPRNKALEAAPIIGASGDERYIPVLIEMIRFGQLGLVRWGVQREYRDALHELSGQDFDYDWASWVEWYGNTEIEPHPEFLPWKGRVISRIDPNFVDFFDINHPSDLRPEEIQWGGVLLDGIPALDFPAHVTPEEATYLTGGEPVFGIALNGEARAYPLQIIDWHEMANDVVGGVPVSLAYCTLCGAAVAFDGRYEEFTFDFGSSGFLYRSNKLMYDRQTRTLWNQLTGEPVLGELVDRDVQLNLLPVVLTTWDEWQSQHPETLVLDIDTGFPRDYSPGAPYGRYFSDPGTMFPVPQRDDALATKQQIYALRINDTAKAYPIDVVAAEGVVNDELGGTNLVMIGGEVIDVSREAASGSNVSIDGGGDSAAWYSAGSEIRVFARGDLTFTAGDSDDTLIDNNGVVWTITEDALVSANGDTLERIPGHLAYWFGWYAFFPHSLVYETP